MTLSDAFAGCLARLIELSVDDGDSFTVDYDYPLMFRPARDHAACRVFTTKPRVLLANLDLDDSDVFGRYGMPAVQHIDLMTMWLSGSSRPVRFIGDLDPLDFGVFLAVRLALGDAGIDVQWAYPRDIAINQLSNAGMLGSFTIALNDTETTQMWELLSLSFDWSDVIGPQSIQLLASGRKLELEALLCNPDQFPDGHLQQILHAVKGV